MQPTPRHAFPRERRGATLIELVVVISILAVAAGIFSQTVVSVGRQRHLNREADIAGAAVRDVLERMRNEDFAQIFALYNDDPLDDPGGVGTAPGQRFAIEGLHPGAGAADQRVGEILLPSVWVEPPPQVPMGETPPPAGAELREDVQDTVLGMPRDLNGDSIVDTLDHADDYYVLPIRVRVEWEGRAGQRSFEMFTILTEFER